MRLTLLFGADQVSKLIRYTLSCNILPFGLTQMLRSEYYVVHLLASEVKQLIDVNFNSFN